MNHINNIEIQNFKSIKHCVIDGCKRINVFVGAPNVGKSNILEGMSLGCFLHRREMTKISNFIRSDNNIEFFSNGEYEKSIVVLFNAIHKISLELNASNDIIGKINVEPKLENRLYEFGQFIINEKKEIIQSNILDEDRPNFLVNYYKFKEKVFPVSKNHLSLQIPDGNNLFYLIRLNSNFRKLVNEYLDFYGLKIMTDNHFLRLFKYNSEDQIFSLPFSSIAETLQRLFFHLIAIKSNKNSVLLFEEPEAQMYPPYISKLTGEIIADDNNNQFFIATHSPYVLNDLMEDAMQDLAIYLVYENEGETKVQRMDEQEMKDAYQFGSDFFMNIPNFIKV